MTWSYSGDPANSDLDSVRFLVRDTDTNDQLVTDEEIGWALAERPNVYSAASLVASTIARDFARKAINKQVGDFRIDLRGRAEEYRALATELADQADEDIAPIPYLGGTSHDEKEDHLSDSDRIDPFFTRRGLEEDREDSDLPFVITDDI